MTLQLINFDNQDSITVLFKLPAIFILISCDMGFVNIMLDILATSHDQNYAIGGYQSKINFIIFLARLLTYSCTLRDEVGAYIQ